MGSEPLRLAVLIDMDSEEPSLLGRMLDRAGTYGTVVVRRVFGNCPKLSDWEECLRYRDIKPVRNYADGKNAADITLIVHAMDLLHSGTVDGFCIISSDNHYAGLVRRLRKDVFVAGIGKRNVPEPFKEAFSKFTDIETLSEPTKAGDRAYGKAELDLIERIKGAIRKASAQDYVQLSLVPDRLGYIDFRAYCHSQLKSLVREYPEEFTVVEGESIGKPSGDYVKIRSSSGQEP